MKKSLLYILSSVVLFGTSCSESWLDTKPSDQLAVEGSIQNVTQVQYAVDGVYDQLSSSSYYNSDFVAGFDVMGDDMRASEPGRLESEYKYTFYTESSNTGLWSKPYQALKNAAALMSVIDDVQTEGEGEATELADLKGQALALRALVHFDLVRVFGKPYTHGDAATALGVPLVIEPIRYDVKAARNTVAEVYAQIVTDLEAAIPMLKGDYNSGRINAWAAKALLSRVYLYMGDHAKALTLAKDVIDNGNASLTARKDYIASWGEGKMAESLFEIVNSSDDNGGLESVAYLANPDGYGQFVAADDFIALLQSKPYDVRSQLLAEDELSTTATPRFGRVMKFPGQNGEPVETTNLRVIRLSEVYLIAAEAALPTDKAAAAGYLNAIVERAYPTEDVIAEDGATVLFDYDVDLPTVDAATITLDRILEERRLELVSEGHRFFDLVRNQKDIVRGSDYWGPADYKTVTMDNHKIIQPIPRIELDANPNMVQNPGYEG